MNITQKELKSEYKEELKKVWDSPAMAEYCGKSIAYVVEHNGELYGIDKPKIETNFCFGYGFNGVSDAEEETTADRMAERAKQDAEYFIFENLENINRWIKDLKEIAEDMKIIWSDGSHPQYMVGTYGRKENCKLRYYSIVDIYNGINDIEICNDISFVEKLIEGYEEVKKDFIKRLNTYLKRYGLSKVVTWSYLRD